MKSIPVTQLYKVVQIRNGRETIKLVAAKSDCEKRMRFLEIYYKDLKEVSFRIEKSKFIKIDFRKHQ